MMGQEEIMNLIEKENIVTINELVEKIGLGRRSIEQSLARMRKFDEIIIIKMKNKKTYVRFYIKKEIIE